MDCHLSSYMNCNISDIYSCLVFKWMSIFELMAIDKIYLLLQIYPKEINRDVDKELYTMIVMAELFIIVQNWKQLEITNNMENVK